MNLFQKKEQIISKRTFSYAKKGVNLSFTLDLGNKEEMSKFKELLEKALLDVSEEINHKELKCPKGHVYEVSMGGMFCPCTGYPGAGGGGSGGNPIERENI